MEIQGILKKIKKRGFLYSLKYSLEELKFFFIRKFNGSYSQRGEDLIIDKLLGNKSSGFYIDVGACNPIILNNTYRFYKKGWKGINIEPQKSKFLELQKQRSKDINLNIGIGEKKQLVDFFEFSSPEISTFSEQEAEANMKEGYKLLGIAKVQLLKLSEVLEKYCKNQQIDFISIDTEGYDMIVLKSNNWKKFLPKLICIESKKQSEEYSKENLSEDYEKFLAEKGYEKIFDNSLNTIFRIKSK